MLTPWGKNIKSSNQEIASLTDDFVVAMMQVFQKANKPCPDDAVIREHAVIETYSKS